MAVKTERIGNRKNKYGRRPAEIILLQRSIEACIWRTHPA